MKKLIIFTFVVLFWSCQKETPVVENSNELATLKIESLKKLLPLTEISSKTKVVFYNEERKEIVFDFELEEELKEKIVASKPYFAEKISGSYINESIHDYSLYFLGTGNYNNHNNTIGSNLFVSAGITQFVESAVTKLSLDDTGTPIIAQYYDTKQLLDKEFENVYSNFIVSEFTSFSEIYYNATYGIIGFKDRQDDLYVFKEFVD